MTIVMTVVMTIAKTSAINSVKTNAVLSRSALWLLAGFSVLWLGACTILETQPPSRVIEPQIEFSQTRSSANGKAGSVRILRPSTDQTRDSRRILVRRADSSLQMLPQHLWLDKTPDMLRSLMLRSLQTAGTFADVHTGGPADWLLSTEIRRFEAVDTDNGAIRTEIELHLRLLNQHSGRIVVSHNVRAESASDSQDTADIIRAFEQSLAEAMAELADWAVEATQSETEAAEH